MLFYDDFSEIVDDIILSQMDIYACNSLLYFLFPYRYRLANTSGYDAMKEIVINGNGSYHITAYDIPYINACTKLVKFEPIDEVGYPILFAMLDNTMMGLDYSACALIKIFSCIYSQPPLMIFVSDESIAFGTVRSMNRKRIISA